MTKHGMLALAAIGVFGTITFGTKWTATIKATDGSKIKGTATVEEQKAQMDTTKYGADIGVTSAPPGTTLMWVIQNSTCDGNGPVLGKESDYPALVVDETGNARAKADLSAVPDSTKEYSVSVRAKAKFIDKVIACGNLEKGK